jgi:large subunit ribosomal protein L31
MVLKKPVKHHNRQNVKFYFFTFYITMAKKNIHPQWYSNTKVYCDGQLVMVVGSTKPELNVDIWSGNHPFYTGSQRIIDTEGRVERFLKKYDLEESK